MTYKQAYDKIIDAYFKDEIRPMNPSFCFCGTLDGGSDDWCYAKGLFYTKKEYVKMEYALLIKLLPFGIEEDGGHSHPGQWSGDLYTEKEGYEDTLFSGMSAALDVLKQIHLDRGEIIDDPIETFKKRELHTHTANMSQS